MSDLATLAEGVALDPLVGHPADYHVFHQFIDRCRAPSKLPSKASLSPPSSATKPN
jgi:hypothetical protein